MIKFKKLNIYVKMVSFLKFWMEDQKIDFIQELKNLEKVLDLDMYKELNLYLLKFYLIMMIHLKVMKNYKKYLKKEKLILINI